MTDAADTELGEFAEKLVEAALNGDPDAMREVAQALDDGSADEEEPEQEPGSEGDESRRRVITVYRYEDETPAQAVAKTALRPTTQAAVVAHALLSYGSVLGDDESLTIDALIAELSAQVKAVTDRNLDRGEAMLAAQAHTLDALYSSLIRKAISQGDISRLETYMKLALRAQSQCRATWEAVSAIQNPAIGYVAQANIANTQQVNNRTEPARTRENQNPPSKLLEQTTNEHDQWLDRGAPTAAAGSDPAMEAVGAVDRPEYASR